MKNACLGPCTAGAALLLVGFSTVNTARATDLLNVSYDPTRELYVDFNAAFAKHYKAETGKDVSIKQSHGGSGKQARSVIDGLEADVVTLALAADIDALSKNGGLVSADWQKRLPDNSSPYTSTIVFLVRKGNPKGIKDWDDVIKPGVRSHHAEPQDERRRALELPRRVGLRLEERTTVTRARPRISWGSLPKHPQAEPAAGCRCAGRHEQLRAAGPGRRFAGLGKRGLPELKEFGADKFEIVTPSVSILAEPPVAVVDKVVDRHGTRAVAEAYLKYLYTPEGQEIAARNFYRPRLKDVADKYAAKFPKLIFSPSTRSSAAGPRRSRSTSTTAASSTRFTSCNN